MWKAADTYEDDADPVPARIGSRSAGHAPFGTKTSPYARVKGLQPRPALVLAGPVPGPHPASEPPKICQANADFAPRLSTRYAFSPKA